MRLLLLGAPGSGKGTQGARLSGALGIPHVASGDLIREHIARGTEFGRRIAAAIAQGNFAPDADIIFWVCRRLTEPDARQGYVLDGFPRDLAQARAFDSETCHGGRAFDGVVELKISEAALVERLSGRLICPRCDAVYHVRLCPPHRAGVCDNDGTELVRRPDDAPETIRRRLEIYETTTLPLHDYYRSQGLLHVVDASQNAGTVFDNIVSLLNLSTGERRIVPLGV